jgi:uncharacterized cofD-like protein
MRSTPSKAPSRGRSREPFSRKLSGLSAQMSDRWRTSEARSRRWFKWLSPGLFIKRWLFISVVGIFLTLLGLAIWVKLTPIFYLVQFVRDLLNWFTNVFPSYISGPMAVLAGVLLVFWGQRQTFGSITQVLMPEGDEELVDMLLNHRRLGRGPKIVAIGGGTGLSNLLRGLKEYSSNITAIVTVADDGGSSGRLRREMGVLPPGDIRNCLAALADEEKLITELFQYRFQTGEGLVGHSFGNLFLSALSNVTGDLEQAVSASSKVLAVRGKVLPATLTDVQLWAELSDGRYIQGESQITAAQGVIRQIGCIPPDPPALPKAIQAIEEADYIIFSSGSLFTSLLPNLLVPEIREAILRSHAPRVYVSNLMTQPGETQGYSVADHIEAIAMVCGTQAVDAVVVHNRPPSPPVRQRYAQMNSDPVELDRDRIRQMGCRLVLANIIDEDPNKNVVRHNPKRLAHVLLRWYSRT